MDKYSGCNIVESVVTKIDKPPVKRTVKARGFFVRLFSAAAVVGVIVALHFAPISALSGVRGALRSVFRYDVFGRTDFGTSVFYEN